MSHHLDSVTAQSDGRLSLLDLYAYNRPDGDTSVLILTVCPEAPKSSPAQLHPDAVYDINIDTDGDLVEDARLRIVAGPVDGGGQQNEQVFRQTGGSLPRPDEAGRTDGDVLGSGTLGQSFALTGGGRAGVGLARRPVRRPRPGVHVDHRGACRRPAPRSDETRTHREPVCRSQRRGDRTRSGEPGLPDCGNAAHWGCGPLSPSMPGAR